MKKSFYFVLFSVFLSTSFFSQSSLTETDVFKTNKIIFYGYDFSHFHVADAKRYGQDLKVYIFNLIGFIQPKIRETQLKKWMVKDSVIFNFDHSTLLNKKINNEDIVVVIKTSITADSLQAQINRYICTEKTGIGNLIIFECFDDLGGNYSAYSVFFDIATKKILLSNWAALNNIGHLNNFSGLTYPSLEIIEYLEKEVYRDKMEKTAK